MAIFMLRKLRKEHQDGHAPYDAYLDGFVDSGRFLWKQASIECHLAETARGETAVSLHPRPSTFTARRSVNVAVNVLVQTQDRGKSEATLSCLAPRYHSGDAHCSRNRPESTKPSRKVQSRARIEWPVLGTILLLTSTLSGKLGMAFQRVPIMPRFDHALSSLGGDA